MMKRFFVFALLSMVLIAAFPAAAQDAISYRSQPDDLAVFLNDVAFVRDTVILPGDTDVELVISGAIFSDTLILRENGERVRTYSLQNDGINTLVRWQADETDTALREVTIEYLMQGIHWTPKYDMFITDDAETVDLDFFAEIVSTGIEASDVNLSLIAGRVDTSQIVDAIGLVTQNQYVAGYSEDGNLAPAQPALTGTATIQYVYDAGNIDIHPGEVVYTEIQSSTLPYRIVNLWNAAQSSQVDRIYKVKNTAELPLAEGIVRSYQDNLFIGSDFIEQTPAGSEGSVTIGKLQNIRVNRTDTLTTIEGFLDNDVKHEITHEVSNFGDEAIMIDIVDYVPANAYDLITMLEPQEQGDNLLRWQIMVEPGETRKLDYEYIAE